MTNKTGEISAIIYKHLQEITLSQEEQQALENWLNSSETNRQVFKNVQDKKQFAEYLSIVSNKEATGLAFEDFAAKALVNSHKNKVRSLNTAWLRYAAAILLFAGLGAYLWLQPNLKKTAIVKSNPALIKDDILPGGNKATLVLADGSVIILDSAADGLLAAQPGATIKKTSDGRVIYTLDDKQSSEAVVYNTMSTPKGGQYQLVLPDGSKVWLNAASSITFPAIFNNKERRVTVKGEAYFEVTSNPSAPFIVDINDKQSVEVLGTSFNINSYTDEGSIKTTLIQGSVKVSNKGSSSKPVILKPGQQAVNNSDIEILPVTNLDQVIAWKNGKFDFNGADLYSVMRQLSRWYDIEVKYKDNITNEIFQGQLTRDLTLSQVLKILDKMEVKFKLEGKTLIVL